MPANSHIIDDEINQTPPIIPEPTDQKIPNIDFNIEIGDTPINPDDIILGGENRLSGSKIEGPIDTPAEEMISDAGGVAIMATDKLQEAVDKVEKKFGETIVDEATSDFVKEADQGNVPTSDPELLEARLRNPRIRNPNGGPNTILASKEGRALVRRDRYIPVEDEPLEPEQADLVEAVATERQTTAIVLQASKKAIEQQRSTTKFLENAVEGELPTSDPELLEARLRNPRIINPNGGPIKILASKEGRALVRRDRYIIAEDEPLEPEQADLVEAVATERQTTAIVLQASKKAIEQQRSTTAFLESAVEGELPTSDPELLEARLRNPRIRNPNGGPYKILASKEGRALVRSDRYIPVEDEPLEPEQADLVEAVAKEVISIRSQISDELKPELEGSLDQSSISAVLEKTIQKRSEIQTEAEVERIDSDIVLLRDLIGIIERVDLAKEFNGLVKTEPLAALTLVDKFVINEAEDKVFINTFLKPVVASVLIKQAAEKVLDPNCPDVIEAIQTLKPLLKKDYPILSKQATEVVTFALQRSLIKDYESVLEGLSLEDLNFSERLKALQSIPILPSLDDFDYTTERRKLIEQGTDLLIKVRTAEIRQAFAGEDASADEILSQILDMQLADGDDLQLQEELLEAYATYIIARRKDRPEDFKTVFSDLSERTKGLIQPELPESLELGNNLRAAKILARNFKKVIAPIFQSLRADKSIRDRVESFIKLDPSKITSRKSFVIDTEKLEAQRDLTDVEREYLESVEALSIFNPHIAAILSEAPEITQVTLESYFSELSSQTIEGIKDGDYFPALLIGLGPNGVAALGEIMRINPDLARDILAIDQAVLPGGPFAVPKGVGWELNSANERGVNEPTLPESPDEIAKRTGIPEEQTVRAYGSPLPFYPGERLSDDKTSRPGSINTTVDYLPTPDDITQRKYATNEDLALIVQAQTAMLAERVALSTEVISVRPNQDPNGKGSKIVRLRMQTTDGKSREVEIQTDAIIGSTGLGEPTYGFDIQGKKAEEVLARTAQQEETKFPFLTDTLGAFEALASKDGEQTILGETLIIYGSGNSTATLAEYIGGLFADADNPSIRNVKKIYIVADGSLSSRERYARLDDLKGRNGDGNLIEFVDGRVADVAMKGEDKVTVLDSEGKPLKNQSGEDLRVDSVIASTGFRPNLSGIFESYLPDGEPGRQRKGLKKVVLPTNPRVAIAETLEEDEDIILIGTGSDSGFQDPAKTEQLPPESGAALIRNSVGNAVAIGFRRADDQAAMRLFVGESSERIAYRSERPRPETRIVNIASESDTGLERGEVVEVGKVSSSLPKIRRDVDSKTSMLTPLLLKTLDGVRISDTRNQSLNFELVAKPDENGETIIQIEYRGSSVDGVETVSGEFMQVIGDVVADPYFQAYWLKAKSDRRERNTAKLQFSFRNGRLDMQQTYAEPG